MSQPGRSSCLSPTSALCWKSPERSFFISFLSIELQTQNPFPPPDRTSRISTLKSRPLNQAHKPQYSIPG